MRPLASGSASPVLWELKRAERDGNKKEEEKKAKHGQQRKRKRQARRASRQKKQEKEKKQENENGGRLRPGRLPTCSTPGSEAPDAPDAAFPMPATAWPSTTTWLSRACRGQRGAALALSGSRSSLASSHLGVRCLR